MGGAKLDGEGKEENMLTTSGTKRNNQQSRIYLIGSGIASFASAVYLEKDAGVPGSNIHILEKGKYYA